MTGNIKQLEIFHIWSDEIENRLDPFFYRPHFEELEKKLRGSNYTAKPLKDIADFIAGYAFSSNDYSEDGMPLIRIQDITDNGVNFETEKRLPFDYLDKFVRFKIRKGDILISMTGALRGGGRVGKIAISDRDTNALLNQRCGIIRSKSEEVLQNYLYAFLSTELFRELLVKHSVISVQVNASETDINSILIPIPPLSVQNEIVKKIQKAYGEKQKKEEEIQKILTSIDGYVLDELGIDIAGDDSP